MTGIEMRKEAADYLTTQLEERKNAGITKVPMFDERDVLQAYSAGLLNGLRRHSHDYLVKTKELQKENKWHDLRKDPEDLPPQDECVFIAQEYDKYSPDDEIPMIAWHDGRRWISTNEGHEEEIGWKVYAWHKIPKIPEEYK